MSAPVVASAMHEQLAAGRTEWVWRTLLQGRVGSWEAEPGSTGSAQWDTLLGALVSSEFERVYLVAPGWSQVARLTQPWMPEHPFLSPTRVCR